MNNNSVPAKRAGIALFVLILVIGVFFAVREIQNQQDIRSKATYDLTPTPVNTCTDIASQSACAWDSLPDAVSYNVTVIDAESKKVIKSESVQAPSTKLLFPGNPGKAYECSVSATNACGSGDINKSQPTACNASQTPMPSPPVCKEDESKCTWDILPEASSYLVKIIDTNTGKTIKSGSASASINEFYFTMLPGNSYECEVTPVNQCGTGTSKTSPPLVCKIPTPTPSYPPTVGIPTLTPTPSSIPSITPTPTSKPSPTPKNTPPPTNTPAPTMTPYPTSTPVPTQPPLVINTPTPTVTQQTIVAQNPVYTTPPPKKVVPTLPPTGAVETSVIVAGISIILVAIGGAIFWIL